MTCPPWCPYPPRRPLLLRRNPPGTTAARTQAQQLATLAQHMVDAGAAHTLTGAATMLAKALNDPVTDPLSITGP